MATKSALMRTRAPGSGLARTASSSIDALATGPSPSLMRSSAIDGPRVSSEAKLAV